MDEICGDGRLSFGRRVLYLIRNFARNLRLCKLPMERRSYCSGRLPFTPATASPGRVLTESFLSSELPRLLPSREIHLLEIGCGSGSLTHLLARFGYHGSYVGVDVADRFDRGEQTGFQREFVCANAHCFESPRKFDLVVSISALEHIPDDRSLIRQLSGFVAPGGLQVHFLPSAWGLPVYLWHGYRQYGMVALGERFDAGVATVYSLGGLASFLLHFCFITLGEMLSPLRMRKRLPTLYGRLLDSCLRLDRWLPVCGTMVAVCLPVSKTAGKSDG